MTRFWGPGGTRISSKRQTDLFGESRIDLKPQSAKQVGNLYRKRLQEVFPFCTVPVVLRKQHQCAPLLLIFGGHNKTGLRIAEESSGSSRKWVEASRTGDIL